MRHLSQEFRNCYTLIGKFPKEVKYSNKHKKHLVEKRRPAFSVLVSVPSVQMA